MVLLFGDYFCDLIFTGLPDLPRLGADLFSQDLAVVPGGAFNLALALTRLQVPTRWAARFGDDLFSRFVREECRRHGLDETLFEVHPQPYRSVSVSFSYAHDRGFLSYCDPLPERDVRPILAAQRADWVIHLPFDGAAETQALLDFAHAQGSRVFSDCQYVDMTLATPGLIETLRRIDIFAPNRSEAAQLTGCDDPARAARELARYCPLVVVKAGADGAYACRGDRVWHAAALDVPVVDTTAAGDCFNAGFLAALLRGEDLPTCLRWGNIAGGLSVTAHGALATPTLAELQEVLATDKW
ncbi:MAG: carbohydrate kinase family protein [Caldilineales bacterium]|nr:carbohydrate kinase family protein [Caldilineales bacterium]